MKNKAKSLILLLSLDLILYIVFSIQNGNFYPQYWLPLDRLDFNAYLVFSFVLSCFYYLTKKI